MLGEEPVVPVPGVPVVPVPVVPMELSDPGVGFPVASVLPLFVVEPVLVLDPALLASFAGRSLPHAVAIKPSIDTANAIRTRFIWKYLPQWRPESDRSANCCSSRAAELRELTQLLRA